jgi:hypothetical protein
VRKPPPHGVEENAKRENDDVLGGVQRNDTRDAPLTVESKRGRL